MRGACCPSRFLLTRSSEEIRVSKPTVDAICRATGPPPGGEVTSVTIPPLVKPARIERHPDDDDLRIVDLTVQDKLKPFPRMRSGERAGTTYDALFLIERVRRWCATALFGARSNTASTHSRSCRTCI